MIDPEERPERIKEIKAAVRQALAKASIDIAGAKLTGVLTELIQEECNALRRRSAQIIDELIERGSVLRSPGHPRTEEALADLAYVLENHYVDDEGFIQVAVADSGEG